MFSEREARAGNILLILKRPALSDGLASGLDAHRFNVIIAGEAEDAGAMVADGSFDAVVIEADARATDLIAVCASIRECGGPLGILVIASESGSEQIVRALDAGADTVMLQPVKAVELAARLRALLRRYKHDRDRQNIIRVGTVELDCGRRTVRNMGAPLHVTPTEFDLLKLLMKHAGSTVHHSHLLTAVWGSDFADETEYLRTFVHQLRKKLRAGTGEEQYVITVPQIGYRFVTASEMRVAKEETVKATWFGEACSA